MDLIAFCDVIHCEMKSYRGYPCLKQLLNLFIYNPDHCCWQNLKILDQNRLIESFKTRKKWLKTTQY